MSSPFPLRDAPVPTKRSGDSVHPELERSLRILGILDDVPTLVEVADDSEAAIEMARTWLIEQIPLATASQFDVVVHGSYARGEASDQSDFDYLVIAHGLPEDIRAAQQLMAKVDELIATQLTAGEDPEERRRKQPGTTGLFGRIASAPDLTERIGLEQDTNVSHTRRLLLVQESVSIYQPDLRERLLRRVLERYLADYASPKPGPPRFLLNDVIRYWYTLAVDYQAKRWRGNDQGWGLRYLKLLLSRRLAYVGTLVSLLLCDDDPPASTDNLFRQFQLPPLARLTQLADDDRFDRHDQLVEAIRVAEDFAGFLRDRANRDAAL